MKKWMILKKKADFNEISRKYGISPITARVMRNRDIISDEEITMYLNGTLEDLHNPFLLKDMNKAVDIISDAIVCNKKIRIVGDYDIDGVCSSTILYRAFKEFGAEVSCRLPDRISDGYGLNMKIIDEAYDDGVGLIVTCDNGIAAKNEIEHAKELGMNVVVTDHHEVPFEEEVDVRYEILPSADAVVDPHRSDCTYPYKDICGGMVAYKLILAMDKMASEKGLHKLTPDTMDMLTDLAAFATVGDIMPLKNENRVIVKHGLKNMGHTRIPGLSALIDVTEIDRNKISAYHIGFILGPCINAIGRLDSANRALELLMTDSYDEAVLIAKELKAANDVRKSMTEKNVNSAVEIVEKTDGDHDYSKDTVLVIYLPDCHESIAGLVAGRIKERYYKPTFVITSAKDGAKGSGRSIEGYNMFEEMVKVGELFTKYGGHPMAAGLSILPENIDELRRRLNENSALTEEELTEKLFIDIDMPINYVSKALIEDLNKLGPFGTGNPGPVFAQKDLQILSRRASRAGNMAFFNLKSGQIGEMPERIIEGKYFGDATEVFSNLEGRTTISVAYTPDINSYRGVETLQISIKEFY